MLDSIDKFLVNLGWFLKNFVYPFATPFFAVLNYLKIKGMLEKDKELTWNKIFLMVSVIYFLFTLGFGIYWLIKNIKDPS